MKPLINPFTKNLSGCSGCGNKLGNPEYDYLWQPKGEEDARLRSESNEANSRDSGNAGRSAEESS